MQTELYEDVLDGRVFRASDIVTFPPEGEGIANSFTTADSFHFSGECTTGICGDQCHTIFFPTIIETFLLKPYGSHQYICRYISTYSER
jgi:hypothetical protein